MSIVSDIITTINLFKNRKKNSRNKKSAIILANAERREGEIEYKRILYESYKEASMLIARKAADGLVVSSGSVRCVYENIMNRGFEDAVNAKRRAHDSANVKLVRVGEPEVVYDGNADLMNLKCSMKRPAPPRHFTR